ncbi:Uma2 family endonuclease [Sorangium sp. So ce1335]|uniref:Uma2 family endonuclease n=1 Tax=Sorangium sp. So ce1335 TaxID=3133335 RepID=UPI003F5E82EA
MSVAGKLGTRANLADLLAIPEEQRFHEIVDGELVRKARPSGPHGRAQRVLGGRIGDPYDRRPGGRLPGGWWIVTETEVLLEQEHVYRPDVLGWRRERLPELPETTPIPVRPDWVCEVLSPTTARNDRVKKMRVYQRCEVPHHWMVDPEDQTLMVYRWTPEGYLLILTAERGERVRAEPFVEVELDMDALFGDEAT